MHPIFQFQEHLHTTAHFRHNNDTYNTICWRKFKFHTALQSVISFTIHFAWVRQVDMHCKIPKNTLCKIYDVADFLF